MPRNWHFATLSVALLSSPAIADHPTVSLQGGAGGPVTTLAAGTPPPGSGAIGLQVQTIEMDELSDERLEQAAANHEHLDSTERVLSYNLVGAVGVANNLMVGFNLPYIERHNLRREHHEHVNGTDINEAENIGDSKGLGDLSVYGQYRFAHNLANKRQWAAIVGVKTPTGSTDEKNDEGEEFEVHHQPGSGSWDPLAGIIFSQRWDRTSVDANILYTLATDGDNDTNLGDIFNYNVAVSRRVAGRTPEEEAQPHTHEGLDFVDVTLELNADWREKEVGHEGEDDNSGGNVVYLSPGARMGWGHAWTASASVGWPVVTNLNGTQSEPELRGLITISRQL